MRSNTYDVIIAGAGSIGTPTALFMAKAGLRTLVIDPLPSAGQASNKHAIGGIRATHSDPAKIYLCAKGIHMLSHWQEIYGDDIEWRSGGYSFVAYESNIEKTLKDLLAVQHRFGLNIHWCSKEEILNIIPDIQPNGLLGGTFSPEDGTASPLKTSFSFWKQASLAGAVFNFQESVTDIQRTKDKITGISTNKGKYACKVFINAAGGWANEVSKLISISLPILPEAHEAGITEPIQPLFNPMVVDMRQRVGSSNFYFYQHQTGKIIFCLTPAPQILGNLVQNTDGFLPLAANRLIEIMPRLMNCRVRRIWRGTYPITPDGLPIVGKVENIDGYLLAVGMCGQGFMLGPGIGKLMSHLVMDNVDVEESNCLYQLRFNRPFTTTEKLK